jgi:capsular exopolysaccharide synthesis family protein
MRNKNDDHNRDRFEIQKYRQRDLPLSEHVDYLKDYIQYKDEEEVHLRDYLNVILKRKSMVLIFFVSVVIIALIFTFMMTPLYKSTAVVKIEGQSPNVLAFKDVQGINSGPDYYQTQYEILKSQSLAERVIRNLGLDKNKDFVPVESILTKAKKIIFDNTIGLLSRLYSSLIVSNNPLKKMPGKNVSSTENEIPNYLTDSLINRLEITPVKNSQLVKVSFISHNPEISMNVTNAVAQTFIEFDLESKVGTSKEARDFLEKQIEIMKNKVEESEKRLNVYASKNEIVFERADQNLITQKLSDLSVALNNMTTERMQKEGLYREVKESGDNNPIILGNSLILGLKKDLSSLEAEYNNLSNIYTSDYPKMKSLKSQMDSIQKRIKQETLRIIDSVQSDYKASLKKEENLLKAQNTQKQKALSFRDVVADYEVLKREVDANKELYNALLKRSNEVGVSAMSSATNIQILDKAVYPKAPYKPNIPLNFLLSVAFGLLGGIGLAFLAEYFDSSVKLTDDIERKLNLPMLGMIPDFEIVKQRTRFQVLDKISPRKKTNFSDLPMLSDPQKDGPVSEAFRSIGAFILLSSASTPPKTILVTGPREKTGKTTVCMNIARALSESLGNGILIDADLRAPKIHRFFNMDNSIGLSTFLSGNIDFDNTDGLLIKSASEKRLSIMTSGPIPPNPSELLGSTRMQDLIYALQSAFEFILIDSPPIMGLPDAIYLSTIVDGTVLVIEANKTTRNELREIRKMFRNINAKILGVILNRVKKDDLKYGSYNYYHSSYYSSYFKDKAS